MSEPPGDPPNRPSSNLSTRELLQMLRRWALLSTVASAWVAAAGFIAVIAFDGTWLAVGWALLAGVMEPDVPELAFPLGRALAPLAISLLSAVAMPITRRASAGWLSLALSLASVAVAVAHLMRLVEAAGG